MRKFMMLIRVVISIALILSSAAQAESASDTDELQISQLSNDVYLHTSFRNVEGYGLVGSNGLVVFDKDNAYMVDTPWSEQDTVRLVDWVKAKGATLRASVSTHSHADRTSGIAYLNAQSIPTYTSQLTDVILQETNKERAKIVFSTSKFLVAENLLEVFYPGGGHTVDNHVVWLPKQKILFGGCLVRDVAAQSLGYVGGASIATWEQSIDRLLIKYPHVDIVVPGHGTFGGVELLAHSKQLASQTTQ
jgi:glyoxylase-like metal-dependent hydrolase (beta-lactamase superfamily II)